MLTIVTLNWARPAAMLDNIRRYASYATVDRILCFNNGPAFGKGALPNKCVMIEASQDLGLWTRFAAGALARTEAILHTDDDILVPESTLDVLVRCWLAAPGSCHGLHGRTARPAYQYGNLFGPVEVVLTRAVVCSRRVNNAALSATPLFDDLRGEPHGNGEDIILSFAAMATSRNLNMAYQLHSTNRDVDHATAIHRRWPGHLQHRQQIVERCRSVFGL
jgi:hypothetical protein